MKTRALKAREHTHDHHGKKIIITTRILVSPGKAASCCTNIVARFTIREPDRIASKRLGELHSSTMKKLSKTDQESDQKSWQREMLSVSASYKGDLRVHSSERDGIQDREKIMLLLHDQKGAPCSRLSQELQQLLSGTQIHYIDKLWVEKQFIGTGIGALVLESYLEALTKLEKGDAFTGPVVLSPHR